MKLTHYILLPVPQGKVNYSNEVGKALVSAREQGGGVPLVVLSASLLVAIPFASGIAMMLAVPMEIPVATVEVIHFELFSGRGKKRSMVSAFSSSDAVNLDDMAPVYHMSGTTLQSRKVNVAMVAEAIKTGVLPLTSYNVPRIGSYPFVEFCWVWMPTTEPKELLCEYSALPEYADVAGGGVKWIGNRTLFNFVPIKQSVLPCDFMDTFPATCPALAALGDPASMFAKVRVDYHKSIVSKRRRGISEV